MLSHSALNSIFSLIPLPCLILLPNEPVFTIAEVNDAYLKGLNLSKEDLVGQSFFEYFINFEGKDMSDDLCALQRVLSTKEATETGINSYNFKNLISGEPHIRYFKAANLPIMDATGEVAYIIHTVTEETETIAIKAAQESVQQNLEEASLLMTQGQELANFGNWQWDINQNIVTWSETLYNIYGLNKQTFKATFEGYLDLLHRDDRERVYNLITSVLHTQKDSVFEERIVRPNGEIRYLKSWGKVQTDEQGNPLKMIGACLDITEAKLAEEQLKVQINAIETQHKHLQDISWIQSHVVRAPLARILGLIELFKNYNADELDKTDLLDKIATSARELDSVITTITNKTEEQVAPTQ
ncbi:PAS domain S-box protein [Mucilaginibacter terrenus]|uniref:histidine kinase n=1 Tax=Mucilaginibacter terrenus TaxID=2482727 RepID=A0A3E2NVA5_9SPHI|nr:PAS domain-containing protein [Mucilaginibacter terrenus]RFZ84887.1 PAS domain S-box protein [Mucilaginibacter terrenus]